MSQYAKQAVITAAASDASIKAKLLDPATAAQALAEVLELTEAEKQEVMQVLQKEDTDEPTATPVDQLNNPGPAVGGGRLFA
jgi:hypothetical protein